MIALADISLVPLVQMPDRCDALAAWLQRERERSGYRGNYVQTLRKLQGERADADLPATLLAIRADELAGSATLTQFSGPLARSASLWLTNVWVHPDLRMRGIGTALVQAQTAAAARHIDGPLLLYTHDQQSFYRRLGWTPLRSARIGQQQVSIMQSPANNGVS